MFCRVRWEARSVNWVRNLVGDHGKYSTDNNDRFMQKENKNCVETVCRLGRRDENRRE